MTNQPSQPINSNSPCGEPPKLRFDLISKDWVIVAGGRGKKPEAYKKQWQKAEIDPDVCVFCNLGTQTQPVLALAGGVPVCANPISYDWTLAVIPNKYPSFIQCAELDKKKEGEFYQTMNAAGFCEIVIPRDHYKHFALMEISQVKEVFDAYQMRYRALAKNKFVNYISIFHNHGVEAGASQPHPHSQIITSPLVDNDLLLSTKTAKKFWAKNKECLNCKMNAWEMQEKKRIIFENSEFLALCPFASKSVFEVVITPKAHLPRFEDISEQTKWALSEAFFDVIKKLYRGLNNPPYNFYIHTSPNDGDYPFYHWHLTIIPRIGYTGGFEYGTRMEIVVVEPERAADYLKDA